ncbi:hypothetical protein NHN26_11630 [Rhodovulum tesquicola]|uniref:Secreted protein n=1 Tax=Rhodovulum steppense TaxID=540251 RepID=A0A4R1YWG4_9RHOB|nr:MULTISPECIES: hypothetical protein [Rhodovulum]MCO8145876.1 hypothetical protein [Rhodovulum tesquicola]TCM85488.1 hypothetical protein EV216_10762 [Rhodovulum steppense]
MRKIAFAAAVVMMAAPLAAQTPPQVTSDLTVTLSPQQYRICNDRPARPSWMDEVHPRETYRVIALMELYEIRAWEVIAGTGDCGCAVRFPAWDSVEGEYRDDYASLTQAEHSAMRREWIDLRKQLEPKVREICEAQGIW